MLTTGPVVADKVAHLNLEGKLTTLVYEAPPQQSTLQVYRNYEAALQNAGFSAIYSCSHKECGNGNLLATLWEDSPHDSRYSPLDINNIDEDDDFRLLTTKLSTGNREVYASVAMTKKYERLFIAVDILEPVTMATELVVIDPEYLNNQLNIQGKVVLHGLFFDFAKASLTAESKPALQVIATYLKQHPKQNFYVVGHTDSVGKYEGNITLSSRRANQVVNALTKQGIKATQLKAVGVGPISPATSNQDEVGRKKNRRVELVLR